MSRTSEQSQDIPADAQSLQSAQHLSVQRSSPTQSQQQSTSQAERTDRSGRGERPRIQRSSSSSSSGSGGPAAGAAGTASGRAEGPVVTSSNQQFSTESSKVQVTTDGALGSTTGGERRQGRYRRQVIRLPDQGQGQVRQVRNRLPTPEPDTIERVYVQRTAGEVVEEITEIPTTPPPRIQERTVVEPAGPPQVIKHTIRVPPRGGAYGGYQQQQQQQQGASAQASGNLLGAGSYGNIQQAASNYQPQASTVYSGAYSGTATSASGYGAFGGNYGSVAGGGYGYAGGNYGSVGGGYQQPPLGAFYFTVEGDGISRPLPPVGCHPAFCFYL